MQVHQAYKKIRNSVSLNRKCICDFAISVNKNLQQTDDPKVWWRHVKAFLSIKSKHTI